MLTRNAHLHLNDVHAQAHISTRIPTCTYTETRSYSRQDRWKKALTQQPCLHWSPVRKKDSYLPPYAPPISDASGWHPFFLTILRAELWDPETKTLVAIKLYLHWHSRSLLLLMEPCRCYHWKSLIRQVHLHSMYLSSCKTQEAGKEVVLSKIILKCLSVLISRLRPHKFSYLALLQLT